MTAPLRVTVVTSCTGLKAAVDAPVAAEDLYRGQHHLRLMRGVHQLRTTGAHVDVWIVSAGHGLVHGSCRLAPYECTFQGRPARERREMSERLQIPVAMRDALSADADLALVLLGEEYLEACQLSPDARLGAPTVLLCGASAALGLPSIDRMRPVALHAGHTREFSCGLVGLKGEIGGRLLAKLAEGALSIDDAISGDVLKLLGGGGPVSANQVELAATLI